MQIKKGLDPEKKIGFMILIIWFLVGSLLLGFQLQNQKSNALGGGFIPTSSHTSAVNATTNVPISGNLQYAVDGWYIVLGITTFNPSIKVSSISDTRGDSYSLAVKSNHYEDTEIWYANYTGTQFTANTITVTFNASTSSIVYTKLLTGVVTGSLQTTSNFGTVATASVVSFTPNRNFACMSAIGLDSGSTTATTFGNSNYWLSSGSSQQLAALSFFNTINYIVNNWNGYGATTVSVPLSPTSSPQWDDVVSCFPEGPATSTTTSTTTTTNTTTTTTTTTTPTTTTTTTPTTTTTTTTNTTTTSTVTSTTTISSNTTTTTTYTNTTTTSTSVSTITGTVIPEPAGSTDILLIFLAIIIALIMIIVGIRYKTPFPTFIGAMVLLIMDVGLYTHNQIVYGSNIFPTPLWVTEMIALFVIISFIIVIYQISKRKY